MAREKRPEEEHCQKVSISFEPKQFEQLLDYCQKEERSMAWCIRKALTAWLAERGYPPTDTTLRR